MKLKLTQRSLNSLPSNAATTVWDTEVLGFGVRVSVHGAKTYVLKYTFAGRQRWYTIGRHGSPFTPERARNEAIRLLGLSKSNVDPAQERIAERASRMTVSELCDVYILAAKDGRILTRARTVKRPDTLAIDQGRIERHIKPLLGRCLVRNVNYTDIEKFMLDVAAGKTRSDTKTRCRGRAIVRGGMGTASRTVGLLGAIFSYGIKLGVRSDNPAHGQLRPKDRRVERFLSHEEMARLGRVLHECEEAQRAIKPAIGPYPPALKADRNARSLDGGEDPIAVAAIRFLMLTGMRKSEVIFLRWSDVNLALGFLDLPQSKTGFRRVVLGEAAIAVLRSMPKLIANPYVFPGSLPGKPLIGLPKIWQRIRKRAELTNFRMHDLRHTFASIGAANGQSLLMIGSLLGHSDPQTTQRYAHLANNTVRAAADSISAEIALALTKPDA